jgi:nicotinamidase-related amidase
MPRALLVIDVQNEYFTGALPVTHPVGHLNTVLAVMDAATAARVPTVVVRHSQPDPNSPVFRKGSKEWELHDAVAARPAVSRTPNSIRG